MCVTLRGKMHVANTVMHARNLPVIREYQPNLQSRPQHQTNLPSYNCEKKDNKIYISKLELVNLPQKPQLYF